MGDQGLFDGISGSVMLGDHGVRSVKLGMDQGLWWWEVRKCWVGRVRNVSSGIVELGVLG